MREKTLTDSKNTPIISREALLSLVEWVKIRRQKHERSLSADRGNEVGDSRESQTNIVLITILVKQRTAWKIPTL